MNGWNSKWMKRIKTWTHQLSCRELESMIEIQYECTIYESMNNSLFISMCMFPYDVSIHCIYLFGAS